MKYQRTAHQTVSLPVRSWRTGVLWIALAGLLPACAASSGDSSSPSGGSSGTGGKASGGSGGKASGGSGGDASGGSSGGSGGVGTAGSGGSPTSTGGTGGSGATGGTGGATPATDGGGGGGAADTGGGDAVAGAARPSAGCGKANPAAGNRTITSGNATVKYIVSVPPGYDPQKPYPLVFAFHGFGRTEVECQKEDCLGFQDALGPTSVLVYQKSISEGWEDAPVRDQNVKAFQDIVALMKSDYCVDESRITISGTSSGASFTNILSCRLGDQVNLSVPFDGAGNDMNCKGTPPAMVVNGVKDNVANGEKVRDIYAARNGCATKPTTEFTDLRTKITAAFNAKRPEYACVDYVGCTKAPVRWCEHSVPGSDGSTHEWPDQGGQAIVDFLKTLK